MIKKRDIINIVINISLLILNIFILALAILDYTNFKLILIIEFSFSIGYNFLKFIALLKEKDFESIVTLLISLGALIATIFLNSKRNYILVFLIFMALMCLLKLIKCDFYHDRHSKRWITKGISMLIYMCVGLISGLALVRGFNAIAVIAYFFIISSILEIMFSLVFEKQEEKNDQNN